jgi:hypothetical protein
MNSLKQALKVVFFGAIWAITLAAASIQSCKAAEQEQSFWVNVGGVSRHFNRSKNFNEVHPGLGVEWRANEDLSVMVGFHKNSLNLRSRYVSVQYQPLHIVGIKFGVSAGLLDGYPLKRDGGAFFAAIPMATVEWKTFGINVGVIPNIPKQHVDGAIVVQFKFRIF